MPQRAAGCKRTEASARGFVQREFERARAGRRRSPFRYCAALVSSWLIAASRKPANAYAPYRLFAASPASDALVQRPREPARLEQARDVHESQFDRIATATFAFICFVWGTTWLAMKIGIATVSPGVFAGLRWTLAGAILLLIRRVRGERVMPPPRLVPRLVFVSVVLISLNQVIQLYGLKYITAGLGAVISSGADAAGFADVFGCPGTGAFQSAPARGDRRGHCRCADAVRSRRPRRHLGCLEDCRREPALPSAVSATPSARS